MDVNSFFSRLLSHYPSIVYITVHLPPFVFRRLYNHHYTVSTLLCIFTHTFLLPFLNSSGLLLSLQGLILCLLKRLSFSSFPLLNRSIQGRFQVLWKRKLTQFGDPFLEKEGKIINTKCLGAPCEGPERRKLSFWLSEVCGKPPSPAVVLR